MAATLQAASIMIGQFCLDKAHSDSDLANDTDEMLLYP